MTNVKVPDGENSAVSQDRMPGSGIIRLEMSRQRGESCHRVPKVKMSGEVNSKDQENDKSEIIVPKTHKLLRSGQNQMNITSADIVTPRKKKKKEEFRSVLEMFKTLEGGKSDKRKTDENSSQKNSARSDQENVSSKINILTKKVQSRPASLKKCHISSKIKPKTNKKIPQVSLQGGKLTKIADIRSFFEKHTKEKTISSFENGVYEGGTNEIVTDKAECRASYIAQPNSH